MGVSKKSSQKLGSLGDELDGPEQVIWTGGWQPNQKYIKTIHLKNKTLNLLKVKFTSPTTRTFSTPYSSQEIKLAAGSVKELPITFRPADFVPYSDFIELETSQKNYRIKLQAKIQTPKFSIPDKIDIGPCAVKEKKNVKFSAKNRSLLDTRFKWTTYPVEFQISPNEGILKASSSSEFDLTFHASNTSLFRGVAVCQFGPEL